MTSYMPQASRKTVSSLTFFFILGLALLLYTSIGRTGLFDVDEAIFAQASVEMLETGDYVTPQYNGEPRYHKPPLIYWVQAWSMNSLGISPFAARLPSAFFAFLMVVGFYSFISGMTRHTRFALTASSILALNFSFFVLSGAATADMALHCFSLLGTLTLLANIYATERSNVPVFIGGFLLGLAMLAKGPVALMVPGIVIGTVWLVKNHRMHTFKAANPLIIIPILILCILPWIYLIIQAKGFDFFKEFWWEHNVGRFIGGMGNTQSESPFYYIAVLLIGFFPWVLLIPSALGWIANHFIKRLRSDNLLDVLPALGLIWGVSVVVFFSFSATKLPHYIVPALPGFALFLAGRLDDLVNEDLGSINWLFIIPVLLLFSSIFIVLKWVPDIILGSDHLPQAISAQIKQLSIQYQFEWPTSDQQLISVLSQNIRIGIAPIMMGAILLTAGFVGMNFMTQGYRHGTFAWAGMMWLTLLLSSISVLPIVYGFTQQSLADIGKQIKSDYTSDDKVYFYAIHQPSVRFISGVAFTSVNTVEKIPQTENANQRFFIFKEERKQDLLDYMQEKTDISCTGGYCLAKTLRQ